MDDEAQAPQLALSRAEKAASAVLPASAGLLAAGEVLHLAAPHSAAEAAVVTAIAAAGAFGTSGHWKKLPHWVAWQVAAGGTWVTCAIAEGPFGRPYAWPALLLGAGAFALHRWARGHPKVIEAQEWRQARADWLADSRRWGLGGSHLLHWGSTRLGEEFIIDVSGTGKLASAIARSDLPERIATHWHRRIPKSRVTVTEHHVAGQVRIEIRDRDPWAEPIPHPVLDADAEVDLSGPCTIRRPLPVGQDPATGRVLAVPLWNEAGGRNVSIVSIKGGGKTVLLNCLSERVTAAPDALMIRVNLSIKGAAESRAWGPACHLTAFGPGQKNRALHVLKTIEQIIEWRSAQQRDTSVFIPSAADPQIVLILDEIDAAMAFPAIRKSLERISSKGRELGVSVVRSGQRGTAEWTGGGNVRSQDDVFCLGAVNRSTEAMHAAGELGLRLPDMASYGEGRAGVWVVAELGGRAWNAGRTWKLSEPPDVARIAAERAHSQPDLPAACKAFLGETYQQLLGTDVYARWAHGQHQDAADRDFTPSRPASPPPDPDEATAPAPVATVTADDNLERLDFDMDDTMQAKFAALDVTLSGARGTLAETEAMDKGPDVPPEKLRQSSAERWRQAGEQAEIPAESMGKLVDLLKQGTTMSKVALELDVKPWTARTWLEKLRGQNIAKVVGERRNAKWVLCSPEPPEAAGDGDGS